MVDSLPSPPAVAGQHFHRAVGVSDVVATFRRAGCVASEAAIVACCDEAMPNTMSRLRARQDELASIA